MECMWCVALKPATLLKLTLLHGCFSRFSNCTNSTKSRNAPHMVTVPNCCLFSLLVIYFCCVSRSKFIIWNFLNTSGIIIYLIIYLYLMYVLTLTCDLPFYELLYFMKLERHINWGELGYPTVIFFRANWCST